MICSVCNKNTAVIFINKIENGKTTTEGLCYSCAKEKGINPMDVISKNANLSEERSPTFYFALRKILQI